MKTITFYSYKGGVGRSLALVNIATRLAEFGKKVCVIDFDLEAPGLHLKFPISKKNLADLDKGIVDYVYEFSNNGILKDTIKDYSIEINISKYGKPLTLIPAGNTNSKEYWKKLSAINWYNLIYENSNGLAFFLNLKETINKTLKPDFLLIDSRTGISEMSGISLSLLADEIVILAANNKENLEGARKIIKSISDPVNNILDKKPNINFVLSRIPFTDNPMDKSRESILLHRIKREYLHPFIDEISVIHSDRELEVNERIKIADVKDEASTQISIDYLKLFEKLTKEYLTDNEIRRFNNIRESERLMKEAVDQSNPGLKIELISRAIELSMHNIDFYFIRANAYLKLNSSELATKDLEHVLSLDELNTAAIKQLIDIFINNRDLNKAEQKVEVLLDINPVDEIGLINKAVIACYREQYEKSEAICTKIINTNPEWSSPYSMRSNVRRLLKRFDQALEDVYRALELNSEDIQAILTLAEIYAEQQKINEFYLLFESALKLNTGYVKKSIEEEEIYKIFKTDRRYLNLLSKYDVFLEHLNDDIT